ncbi:GNAT family N-acetyltransferase [Terrimonas ferruginea]|uniref:GNAT family N-acetyltransferase n=1 Tax=Terrimonas ferruginea TaxID=249 RepID=UPI000415D810|nr:GNAT family N-acetyltransferase [Terrimonas ferruginea]
MPAIRYIKHADLDKAKWDECLEKCSSGLLYAHSFYLDCMAPQWDALVLGDYEAVMPLTWNKKYGIHYLYQPAFTPMLGVFATSPVSVKDFINAIPAKFKLTEISLNSSNDLRGENVPGIMRRNYLLDLSRSADELKKVYRESHRRNLRKAIQLGCVVKKDIPLKDIIALSKLSIAPAKEEDYLRFGQLFTALREQGNAETIGVYGPQQQLLASAVFFRDSKRAYYILVGNDPAGKTVGASHLLIDHFITTHAGQSLLLDFEGSDINSLAFFYEGFGAQPEWYPAIRINRLPFYLKWLKK